MRSYAIMLAVLVCLVGCKTRRTVPAPPPPAQPPPVPHTYGAQLREFQFSAGTNMSVGTVDNANGTQSVTYTNTSTANVNSVTGAGSTSCSPTTGNVTCTTTNSVSNGLTGDTTLGAHGVLVGEGTSAVVSVGSGGSCTNGQPLLCLSGASDPAFGAVNLSGSGVTGTLSVGSGGTGVTTITNHAVMLGSGSSAISSTGPTAAGWILTSNGTGTDPTFDPPSTPSTIFSDVAHQTSAVALSGSYQTITSITDTWSATIDCHAVLTWDPSIGSTSSITINYGISEDSTTTPTTVRQLAMNTTSAGGQALIMAGGDVERYTGSGSHVIRLLAEVSTSSGTITQDVATGDLICETH